MMPCKLWREEWIAHLYGETTADERRAIEEHLAECSACAETLQELQESRLALAESVPPVPDAPRVVVLRSQRKWSPAWAFATGVAAATLVFFFGTLLGSPATQSLEKRVAQLEAAPTAMPTHQDGDELITRAQFDEEIQRVTRRHRRERAEDLDHLARYFAASEQRTGTFMNQTQEALTYLALRGDPRLSER
jgi:anti-sigma factor RsiW